RVCTRGHLDERLAVTLVEDVRDEVLVEAQLRVRRFPALAQARLSPPRQLRGAIAQTIDVPLPFEIELETPVRLGAHVSLAEGALLVKDARLEEGIAEGDLADLFREGF